MASRAYVAHDRAISAARMYVQMAVVGFLLALVPAQGSAKRDLPQRDPLDHPGPGGTASLGLSSEPAFLPAFWSRLLCRVQPAEPLVLKDTVCARCGSRAVQTNESCAG